MKKKLLSTLLCAAMAVSMLAGCGGSDSNAKKRQQHSIRRHRDYCKCGQSGIRRRCNN
ncbi:MAG: hypothetical protein ACLSFA_20155 [Roseburia inulinivorans]